MAAESLAVPLRHGVRLYDDQVARPPRPSGAQCHPESAVSVIEWRPRPLFLEHRNLLLKRQLLDDQIVTGTAHALDGTDAQRDEDDRQAKHAREVCRPIPEIPSHRPACPSAQSYGVSHCF